MPLVIFKSFFTIPLPECLGIFFTNVFKINFVQNWNDTYLSFTLRVSNNVTKIIQV